jgi:hypothetical protein
LTGTSIEQYAAAQYQNSQLDHNTLFINEK